MTGLMQSGVEKSQPSRSNYQVEALASAIAFAYGNGEVTKIERDEAADMVDFLTKRGWRLTREDHTNEYVTDGPIQRALGIDGGDGF